MKPPILFNPEIPLSRRIIGSLVLSILWIVYVAFALLVLWVVVAVVSDAWHGSVQSEVRELVRPDCIRR